MCKRLIPLARSRLPSDPADRHAVLRNYMCDKDAILTPADGGWHMDLEWPRDPNRHIDPAIEAALADWEDIGHGEMWGARRRSGRILAALYDTWTLQSWSEWLSKRGSTPSSVTILHADDHRDFGSPRLFVTADGLVDPFTGQSFDVRDPTAVQSAIASGAVGMGSFMTPFLHAVPCATIRHLCQPPKVRATQDQGVEVGHVTDELLDHSKLRPALTLKPADGATVRYRATSNLFDWLDGLPAGDPILVHIDMDYFNNRYDGDSDWSSRPAILDPDLPQILSEIDRVIAALSTPDVASRIEDIVIAFSPGFFPAEYWRIAGTRIESGLRAIR